MNLLAMIVHKIKSRPQQAITFYEYMNDCLYHPEYGYYMQNKPKIGKEGDFYTTSHIHPVYAEMFANVAASAAADHRSPLCLIEAGAGTGRFARPFLDEMEKAHPSVYRTLTYTLIEKSQYHKEAQQQTLKAHLHRVRWVEWNELQTICEGQFPIFYSNELVDAFAVHLIEHRAGITWEVGVTWNDRLSRLEEIKLPLEDDEVIQYLDEHRFELGEGQRIEVSTEAVRWVKQVATSLPHGLWFTVDYGLTHEELTFPSRKKGTLLCYSKHRVDENPYERPGQKDITSHVHFDVLSDEAEKQGWRKLACLRQHQFLLQAGILNKLQEQTHQELFQQGDPFQNEALRKNRAIRQLISPEGISASFRILVLGKGRRMTYPFLQSFSFQNKIQKQGQEKQK